MSKQDRRDRNYHGPIQKQEVKPMEQRIPEDSQTHPARRVPSGKQEPCEVCYTGELNGIGQSDGYYRKAQTLHKRYYKCDRCGYTWTRNISPERVID